MLRLFPVGAWSVLGLLICGSRAAAEEPWAASGPAAAGPAADEVDPAAFLPGLHSASFIQRDWATRRLMRCGPAAVHVLRTAILQAAPDVVVAPEVELLREMSLSQDAELAAAAVAALVDLHRLRDDLSPTANQSVADGYHAMVRHALARLAAWGADLERDPFGQVVRIRIHSSHFGDRQMSLLAAVSTLTELDVRGTRISGAGLARLAPLSALQQLNLTDTPLTDGELRHLPALPNLQRIALYRVNVSAEDLQWLQDQFPNCEVRMSQTGL